MAAFDGGSMTSDTGLLLRRLDQRLSLLDLVRDLPGMIRLFGRPVPEAGAAAGTAS